MGCVAVQTMQVSWVRVRLTGQYTSLFLRCWEDTKTGTQQPPYSLLRNLNTPCTKSGC